MGGGRSGLFLGTEGADMYQESLFPETSAIRRKGFTYVPVDGNFAERGVASGRSSSDKLRVLTVKDILQKFMDYRFGEISESRLVQWIQMVLQNRQYYIEAHLRLRLTNGLSKLKKAKTASKSYDPKAFLAEIEKIENTILSN